MLLFSEDCGPVFDPLTSIKAKLLNLLRYFNEFLKIFLLKLKKLFGILVEITLTLDALF